MMWYMVQSGVSSEGCDSGNFIIFAAKTEMVSSAGKVPFNA